MQVKLTYVQPGGGVITEFVYKPEVDESLVLGDGRPVGTFTIGSLTMPGHTIFQDDEGLFTVADSDIIEVVPTQDGG